MLRTTPEDDIERHPMTFLHLLNQFLVEPYTMKDDWPVPWKNSSYNMNFLLTGIEVLKRRNKHSRPCVENHSNDFDRYILGTYLLNIGCKPPYLNFLGNFSTCKSKEELKTAYFDAQLFRNTLIKPCTSLENINFRNLGKTNIRQRTNGKFRVVFVIADTFKEIHQERKVDIHTFIGNSGGYIGLFCGRYLLLIGSINLNLIILITLMFI